MWNELGCESLFIMTHPHQIAINHHQLLLLPVLLNELECLDVTLKLSDGLWGARGAMPENLGGFTSAPTPQTTVSRVERGWSSACLRPHRASIDFRRQIIALLVDLLTLLVILVLVGILVATMVHTQMVVAPIRP